MNYDFPQPDIDGRYGFDALYVDFQSEEGEGLMGDLCVTNDEGHEGVMINDAFESCSDSSGARTDEGLLLKIEFRDQCNATLYASIKHVQGSRFSRETVAHGDGEKRGNIDIGGWTEHGYPDAVETVESKLSEGMST